MAMQPEQKHSGKGIYADLDTLISLSSLAREFRLESHSNKLSMTDGGYRSTRRGRGMEFSEVRPYQAGDDVRNIDWRVTARTQETYTKLFQEEKERPVYLLVDQRPSMFFGSQLQFKSTLAAELSAFIAWCATANGDRLGALIFSSDKQADLRAKQGKRAVVHFLQALTEANHALSSPVENSQHTMSTMLDELQRVSPSGSLVYVISDFHDMNDDCRRALSRLGKKCDLEFLHIVDPIESTLPNCDFQFANLDSKILIRKGDKKARQQYADAWRKLEHNIQDQALLTRARYRQIGTHSALTQQLTKLFKRNK